MKSKMAKKLVILGVLGLLVGCSNKIDDKDSINKTSVVEESEKPQIVHDIIEMPAVKEEEGYKFNDYLYVVKDGKPEVISRLINKGKKRVRFTISNLNKDNTWTTQIAPWSENCNYQDLYSVMCFSYNAEGVLYALMLKQDFTNPIIRCLGDDGKSYDIDMQDVKKTYPNRFPYKFSFIDNNRCVLYMDYDKEKEKGTQKKQGTYRSSQDIEAEKTLMQVYNIAENRMESDKEFLFYDVSIYDKDLRGYVYNPENDAIVVKKMGDKISERMIKCGLKEFWSKPRRGYEFLSEDGDKGYLLSEFGIVGGNLDAEKWDWIVDRGEFVLGGDEEIIKRVNSKGMTPMGTIKVLKGNESDYDFYRLMRYANNNESEMFWVYYHEKEV
ncbi:hypothetical protein [Eubacterium xylanophilum]|uniref:hypothetical protein n=1 Tax=Eubacterium xylanophilum TaxID=39497 RepID=UPI00047DCF19|nr:hypothetical protein [Eubacterium xylanophilum]